MGLGGSHPCAQMQHAGWAPHFLMAAMSRRRKLTLYRSNFERHSGQSSHRRADESPSGFQGNDTSAVARAAMCALRQTPCKWLQNLRQPAKTTALQCLPLHGTILCKKASARRFLRDRSKKPMISYCLWGISKKHNFATHRAKCVTFKSVFRHIGEQPRMQDDLPAQKTRSRSAQNQADL